MTDREERQHVIKVLQNMLDWMEAANMISSKPERIEAVKYAIASIETDLKYDLLYEETSGQADKQADKPTTKNDVPDNNVGNIYTCSCGYGWDKTKVVRHHFCPNCGKVVEPTAKNNLEVDLPDNNVGNIDCISRADAQTKIEMNASRYSIAKERGGMGQVEWSDQLIKVSDAVDIIRALPPVTPQEPKTGHWIPIYQGDEIIDYRCSECEFGNTFGKGTIGMNFCPRCGSDNREVEE